MKRTRRGQEKREKGKKRWKQKTNIVSSQIGIIEIQDEIRMCFKSSEKKNKLKDSDSVLFS